MKKSLTGLVAFTVFLLNNSAWGVPLMTNEQKLSYAMGAMTAKALKNNEIYIDPKIFSEGLAAGYSGQKLLLSDKEMRQIVSHFQQQAIAKMQLKLADQAAKNEHQGEVFLAHNKTQPGVQTLPSGLQYKILQPGNSGAHPPSLKDVVVVHYEGRLLNGKVFDSSYLRGKPATFSVNSVIEGWQQALTRMQPGATWELYVPPKLAYAAQGAPDLIGPNETLIFKVNLISVVKK